MTGCPSLKLLGAMAVIVSAGCSQAFHFASDSGKSDGGCTVAGACECQSPSECPLQRPVCAANYKCVECTLNSDCGPKGLCDPKTQRCTTACDAGLDCAGGVRNRCGDDLPRHCVACDDNPSCPLAATPYCAESVGFCVQCEKDSHCDGGLTRCDTRFGSCVQCLNSGQCAPTEFCRLASGVCEVLP